MKNSLFIICYLIIHTSFGQKTIEEKKQYNNLLKVISLIQIKDLTKLNTILSQDVLKDIDIKKTIKDVEVVNKRKVSLFIVLSYEEKDVNIYKCNYNQSLNTVYQLIFYFKKNSFDIFKILIKDELILEKELKERGLYNKKMEERNMKFPPRPE